jgi:hypothetical protein
LTSPPTPTCPSLRFTSSSRRPAKIPGERHSPTSTGT